MIIHKSTTTIEGRMRERERVLIDTQISNTLRQVLAEQGKELVKLMQFRERFENK